MCVCVFFNMSLLDNRIGGTEGLQVDFLSFSFFSSSTLLNFGGKDNLFEHQGLVSGEWGELYCRLWVLH